MNPKQISSERGQAVVLLVFAMIVLLGFTALAVDGSMVYSDRRFAQNGADAASLAGGGAAAAEIEKNGITYKNWPCNSTTPTTSISGSLASAASAARSAAIARAKDNSFTIDQDISDNHGVQITCGAEGSGPFRQKYLDVHTVVTMDTQTAFAHFVFDGIMRNTVEAITRVRPRQPAAFGYAIVSLNPDTAGGKCTSQGNGVQLHGNVTTDVEGGGIFSNGCITADGMTSGKPIYVTNGSVNANAADMKGAVIYSHDGDTDPTNDPVVPVNIVTDQMPEEAYAVDLDPAVCNDTSLNNVYKVSGSYFSGTKTLSPGLYCVTSDIKIQAKDNITANGVTIFLINNTGITINGGATMVWSAPEHGKNVYPAIAGLLIYAPFSKGTNNVLQIAGNASSSFTGTILAPQASIDYMGTSNSWGNKAQIIGWNVELGGTTDLYIDYSGDVEYLKPTNLDLYR